MVDFGGLVLCMLIYWVLSLSNQLNGGTSRSRSAKEVGHSCVNYSTWITEYSKCFLLAALESLNIWEFSKPLYSCSEVLNSIAYRSVGESPNRVFLLRPVSCTCSPWKCSRISKTRERSRLRDIVVFEFHIPRKGEPTFVTWVHRKMRGASKPCQAKKQPLPPHWPSLSRVLKRNHCHRPGQSQVNWATGRSWRTSQIQSDSIRPITIYLVN